MNAKIFILIGSIITRVFSQDIGLIKQIKDDYLITRKSLAIFKVDSTGINGESSEGGIEKYYRDSTGDIRLIVVKIYGEMGNNYEEYYYKKTNLFFFLSTDVSYNAPFYMTGEIAKEYNSQEFNPKKSKLEENRYYFENDSLILWLGPDNKPIEKTKYKEALKTILDQSKKYQGKAKKT